MQFEPTAAFAAMLDEADPLASFRKEFYFPKHNGQDVIYLTGNSLGLQPKGALKALETELDAWAKYGVEGHFEGQNPWFHYHKFLTENAAYIAGAQNDEVVVMNNLTVNLHLMMVSFYRPGGNRYKIIMEAGAFPSDMYAVESQVKFHGYNYHDAVIEVKPRPGEHTLRNEDILQIISENASSIALVMFSGVQYYTGQVFDIEAITKAAHQAGAVAGFDLAHAAGNIQLQLHNWDVDFAVWCTYKYLNSGPGSVSGVFVHQRHADNHELPRFAGWWGHKESVRFNMERGFIPEHGAAGWQLSNAPVFNMAIHKASLQLFRNAGMERLTEKSKILTAFLEQTLIMAQQDNPKLHFTIITPQSRGCQLSILAGKSGKKLFEYLTANGVIADWREPEVIRMAPVPMYNSFSDIHLLGKLLREF